jgi:hypothetical protein
MHGAALNILVVGIFGPMNRCGMGVWDSIDRSARNQHDRRPAGSKKAC